MKTFIIVLLFLSKSFAEPTETRLSEIQNITNGLNRETMFNDVEVTFDLDLPNPAAAFFIGNGKYKISINQNIFSTLSKAAQNFVGFHELGHIYLEHTEMDPKLKNRYEIELEADAFASYLFLRFGEKNQDLTDFIQLIESKTSTTPPGDVRAQLIRKIIL